MTIETSGYPTMPIAVVCDACKAEYSLRDEFAGKKVRCKNCQEVLVVPEADTNPWAAPGTSPRGGPRPARAGAGGPFDNDKFLVNQKRFAINERYFITDEDKNPLMMAERPTKILRSLGAMFGAVVTFIVVFVIMVIAAAGLQEAGVPEAVAAVIGVVGFIAAVFATIAVAVVLSPYRHVTFYTGESKEEALLVVHQDRKFYGLRATYSVKTPEGEPLGQLVKNYIYNIFRKQWRINAPDGRTIALAKEDSLILSLLRRFLGPLFGILRTNFVIVDPEGDRVIGEFNRKFTLFDRYVLDMSDDRDGVLDRRLAIGLGVMLDTGERR